MVMMTTTTTTSWTCLWSRDAAGKKKKRWSDGSLELVGGGASRDVKVVSEEGATVGTTRLGAEDLEQYLKWGGEFRVQGVSVSLEGGMSLGSTSLEGKAGADHTSKNSSNSCQPWPMGGNLNGRKVPTLSFSSAGAGISAGAGKWKKPQPLGTTRTAAGQTRNASRIFVEEREEEAKKDALIPDKRGIEHGAAKPKFRGFKAPRVMSTSVHSKAVSDVRVARNNQLVGQQQQQQQQQQNSASKLAPMYPHQDLVGFRIAKHLKPHQREGFAFLWKRISPPEGGGAILADEMGLGKTLTAIATMSASLRLLGKVGLKKVAIVCPSSLVCNWVNEISKWGGIDLSGRTVAATKAGSAGAQAASDFMIGSSQRYGILIISYELFRSHEEWINAAEGLDLLICDEAHRLKGTSGSKTMTALAKCPARRRLLITGTPVQNNLDELWCLANFACPGILGPLRQFRERYGNEIDARDGLRRSSRKTAAVRSLELGKVIGEFMLRRSKSVAAGCLPCLSELVVFCRLSAEQTSLYSEILGGFDASSSALVDCGGGGGSVEVGFDGGRLLGLVGDLRKVCNDPRLLEGFVSSANEDRCEVASRTCSSKLEVLFGLLEEIKLRTQDRVVISSFFTSTLDIIGGVAEERGWKLLRLDGSTPANERQDLVDEFNGQYGGCGVRAAVGSRPMSESCGDLPFLFLLSSKAGGVGLNLTGANRLVLYDSDWNPATDAQTMARVWRFGQEKPVTVYRLVTAGTIEENILQRQLLKDELQAVVQGATSHGGGGGGKRKGGSQFTREELKELLLFDGGARCLTFEKLERRRKGIWEDYEGPEGVLDVPLAEAIRKGVDGGGAMRVTFVHASTRDPTSMNEKNGTPLDEGGGEEEEEEDESDLEGESSQSSAAVGGASVDFSREEEEEFMTPSSGSSSSQHLSILDG